MDSVFEAKNHVEYLRFRLEGRPSVRGIKSQFANALRVQPAYLSQVLSTKHQLSLEQADFANQFFDHDQEEAGYFILLVSRDRAGTESLRKHYERQLQQILKRRMNVIERVGKKVELSDDRKGIYYSSWLYAAIHIACTIPHFRTRRALVERLRFPPETISQILDFLVESQLLKKVQDEYFTTENWVSLGRDSPFICQHHFNWKQKALENIELQTEQDLHFSGIYSLDTKVFNKIHDLFLRFLKEQTTTIASAKEEDLYILSADFFRVKR